MSFSQKLAKGALIPNTMGALEKARQGSSRTTSPRVTPDRPAQSSDEVVNTGKMSEEEFIKLCDELTEYSIALHKSARALRKELRDSQGKLSWTNVYDKLSGEMKEIGPYPISKWPKMTEDSLQNYAQLYAEKEDSPGFKAMTRFMEAKQGDLPELQSELTEADATKASNLKAEELLDIHEKMANIFKGVVREFFGMTEDYRHSLDWHIVESASELIVSLKLEQSTGISADVIEQAVKTLSSAVTEHPRYLQAAQMLAGLLRELQLMCKPKMTRDEFKDHLQKIANVTKKSKELLKELNEKVVAKSLSIFQAYKLFIEFARATGGLPGGQDMQGEGDLSSLDPMEMRQLHEQWGLNRDDEEIKNLWEESNSELSTFMQIMTVHMQLSMQPELAGQLPPPPLPKQNKKLEGLTSGKVLEMQDCLNGAIKNLVQKVNEEATPEEKKEMEAEPLLALIQGMATSVLEREHGVTGEDMTFAGFQFGEELSQNPRFLQASQEQQQLLMSIGGVVGASGGPNPGCCVM